MAFSLLFHGIKYFSFVAVLAPFPSFAYCSPFRIAPPGTLELVAPIL